MLEIDENKVSRAFDDLVARKIILYGPETVTHVKDQGFEFEFRICPALASKPGTASATSDATFASLPKYGPGSDLVDADPALTIGPVNGGTHLLVLNRFAVFARQFLVLTADSFRRQTESLDAADFDAAWAVLQALEPEPAPGREQYYVMFNCGHEAGCSRLHKHTQVIPYPADGRRLFPDVREIDDGVPFKCFIHRFDGSERRSYDDRADSSLLVSTYERLCEDARAAWRDAGSSSCGGETQTTSATTTPPGFFPHNMMLTKRWMMVVPRRRAEISGASANAAGMMGMVWVTNPQQMERWMQYGPAKVLAELGVPR